MRRCVADEGGEEPFASSDETLMKPPAPFGHHTEWSPSTPATPTPKKQQQQEEKLS